MNKIIQFTTLLLIPLCLTCCGNEDIDSTANTYSYVMHLTADAPNYQAIREGTTRASGNAWEEGDVIYLSFSNQGNVLTGSGVYNRQKEYWNLTLYTGELSSAKEASCKVYYFRGGTISATETEVSFDETTAIFCDESAIYSYSGEVIYLEANLTPHAWRLCFKGEVGTSIQVDSIPEIEYFQRINLKTGAFSSISKPVTGLVQADGYTPYFYGKFTADSLCLLLRNNGIPFLRSMQTFVLRRGESGYFNIPTLASYPGWQLLWEVNRDTYAEEADLDNTPGSNPQDHTTDTESELDVNRDDYSSDKDLDDTPGSTPTPGGSTTGEGEMDISKDGYSEDKNLD